MSLVAPTRNTFAIEDELGGRRGSVLNHVQEEKPMELLAPAGTLEKGKTAIAFGANALYLAGQQFGLRARAGNFSEEDMAEMVAYAHERGVKVYVTANIIPHNRDLVGVHEYFQRLGELGIDALIVADPGILALAREILPEVELHLSTQASMTNWRSARFWYEQGVKRIILARELSAEEIGEIKAQVPEIDLEVFVHGAMCVSYSGRCLLSAYMAGRDANLGDCAQPCRWKYHLMEEKRPGEYFPIEESEEGTFIFNSRDLCLIGQIPDLARLGVTSLKIEGRMKSVHYVATVVGAYRRSIDGYYSNPAEWQVDPDWLAELDKVSHRPYTTGFFTGRPGAEAQDYGGSNVGQADFVGMVTNVGADVMEVDVRNRIEAGEHLELLVPQQQGRPYVLEWMRDCETRESVSQAHPNWRVQMPNPGQVTPYSILRRKK